MASNGFEGRRILVVEDEALLAMYIEDTLEPLGCEVVGPVASVEDALPLVAGNEIDAALLDVNLGGGENSYPVADALAERGIAFGFLTGYGEQGIRADHSGTPVLSKPFDEKGLEDVLSRLLSRPRA